jgi:hypothetical protein
MLELDENSNTVIKNNAGGVIIKTSDVSCVIVTDTTTEIANKLKTSAGIIGPTTAFSYTSDMVGYSFVSDSTDVTFTSGSASAFTTTIATGNWLYSCAQIITRGSGTFPVAPTSLTQLQVTASVGAPINGMNMFSPLPIGSTIGRLVFPMTTGTLCCKSETTITISSTTVMTVGIGTKRLSRIILTRIS